MAAGNPGAWYDGDVWVCRARASGEREDGNREKERWIG